jgi:hypothetical protein
MPQQSIVFSLNRKGWTAQVIHDDLVATLGEDVIAYRAVTKYLRSVQISAGNPNPRSEPTSFRIDESNKTIFRALEELTFSSVRQLSPATHLSVTMVYRRLSEKLGFSARHLRWVRHLRCDNQKGTRVRCSRSLLTILLEQETRD